MLKNRPRPRSARPRLLLLSLAIGIASSPVGWAQQSFPQWSAWKRIPTESTRATFPDIVAIDDTIHVVFRATFTDPVVEEGSAAPVEEQLMDELIAIRFLLRNGTDLDLEVAGGKKKLLEDRERINKELAELREGPTRRQTGPLSPVQTAIFYTRSDDRGRTFLEDPLPITERLDLYYGQTALQVNEEGIHVVFTSERGDNVIGVYATHSKDDGQTWEKPEKISSSNYHAFDPKLVPIPRGLLVTWWEKEESEIKGRTRIEWNIMSTLIDDPHFKDVSTRESRSIIHTARYLAGSWETPKVLDSAPVTIPFVNVSLGPEGEIYIYWQDDRGPQMRVSRAFGTKDSWQRTIDFAQIIGPDESNVFLHDGREYRFVRGNKNLRRSAPLFHREGLLVGDWEQIIGEQAQHSYPRIAFTKDEVQVVWGTTALSGNDLIYFREDITPPTSELVYPPDGDFTKPALVFMWRGVDDIATRITYRKTIQQRQDPTVRPEPHNWTPYEESETYSIKPLPDGYYTIYIQATDFSGNEETIPSAFDFQTYNIPPKITADRESLPPIEIETRNIELKWKVEDNTPENDLPQIGYRLDGAPVTQFAPRTSVRINGLRAGWHQIQLFSKDEKGNVNPFGETVSVSVKLILTLDWKARPAQPRQDDVVFVKGDMVDLSWVVQENTSDRGVTYVSSYRVNRDKQEGPWSVPDYNLSTQIAGPDNSPLPEGPYTIQLVAQDEYGNHVGTRAIDYYIQTDFTVDRTPPTVEFNTPILDEETKEPTLTVVGEDNYTHRENIVYQFRINEGTAAGVWSGRGPYRNGFFCQGHPVKWYSWGYTVDVRAQDVAENVSASFSYSFIWYDRSRWMLYTLIGIAVVLVTGILFVIVSATLERRRAKKRAAARKKAQDTEEVQPAQPETDEDDLFEVPAGPATASANAGGDELFGGGPAPTSSPGMTTETRKEPTPPMEDPFASPEPVLEDPFAEKEDPASSPFDEPAPSKPDPFEPEDEPLEIGGGAASSQSAPTQFEDLTPTIPLEDTPDESAPPKKKPGEEDELDDQDLFDPL